MQMNQTKKLQKSEILQKFFLILLTESQLSWTFFALYYSHLKVSLKIWYGDLGKTQFDHWKFFLGKYVCQIKSLDFFPFCLLIEFG
jgi:hypothetical protein